MLSSGPGPWQGEGCSGHALLWASRTPFFCTKCGDSLRPTGEVSPCGHCDMGLGWSLHVPV